MGEQARPSGKWARARISDSARVTARWAQCRCNGQRPDSARAAAGKHEGSGNAERGQ